MLLPALSLAAALASAAPDAPAAAWIGASAVNLRAAASKSAAVRMKLPFATPVVVVGAAGDFTEIEIASTPPHRGFVATTVLRRGPLAKSRDDERALSFLQSSTVAIDPWGEVPACAGTADVAKCTEDAHRRARNEARDGLERAATFGPDRDLARLTVLQSFVDPIGPYAQTPPEVLATSPWLQIDGGPRALDPRAKLQEEARDVAARVEACAPAPKITGRGPWTADIDAVGASVFDGDVVVEGGDDLLRARAAIGVPLRLRRDPQRGLVSVSTTTEASYRLLTGDAASLPRAAWAPRMTLTTRLSMGPAPAGVDGRVVAVFGKVPVAAAGGKPSVRELPTTGQDADFCSRTKVFAYDVDGDGRIDAVTRSYASDPESTEVVAYDDVLFHVGAGWTKRLLGFVEQGDL